MSDNVNSIGGGKLDRDIPSLKIKKKKTNISKLVLVGLMLLALLVVASGAVLFAKRLEARKAAQIEEKKRERPKETTAQKKDFESAKRRIRQDEINASPPAAAVTLPAPAAAAGNAAIPTPPASAAPIAVHATSARGAQQAAAVHAPTATQRRLDADVLVSVNGEEAKPVVAGNAYGGATPPPYGPPPSGNLGFPLSDANAGPKNGFDEKLKPSQLLGGVAAQRPDLSMLMRRGTSIACGQKTSITTTHPGMVSCVISKDVYSADGKVLLIERGSEAFGEQRTALLQGQASIEVLWSRIDTPRGVAIDINSLGTDALGASGIPAYVDNHIWQRFGGAVMLSLISDFGQALANKSSSSEGEIKLSATSTTGQDLAVKTLDNTINIPPTAYSVQGSAINIFVARDMDFRSVYELVHF